MELIISDKIVSDYNLNILEFKYIEIDLVCGLRNIII